MSTNDKNENVVNKDVSKKESTEPVNSNKSSKNKNKESKGQGKISKFLNAIKKFALEKTSLFIVIIIGIIFLFLAFTYETLHLTSTTSFCGTCHVDAESGPGGEFHTWEKNIHGLAGVGCIDCHGKPGFFGYMRAKIGGMYDVYAEIVFSDEEKYEALSHGAFDKEHAKKLTPNDWCLICHSDADNQRIRDNTSMSFFGFHMREVDKVKNPEFRQSHGLPDIFNDDMPSISFSHDNHVNNLGLSCIECHHGVAHGGEFSNKTKMETCFKCHDTERAKNPDGIMPENESCMSCHARVVSQHEGTLLESKGVEVTKPAMMQEAGVFGAENCFSCHADAFTKPTRETCGPSCHGTDEDGNDIHYGDVFDSIRADYDALKAPLDKVNVQLYKVRDKMNKEQLAKFNEFKDYYQIIYSDKSKGIHNNELSMITIEKANALASELAKDFGIEFPAKAEENAETNNEAK